jgi:outer membrane protein assembly factor BamA
MTLLAPMRLSMLACLCGWMMAQAQNAANPPASKVIEEIQFRGVTHVPLDILRETIAGKAGDVYSEEALRRDFTALWKTGFFTDIQLKTEPGAHGGVIVRFDMTELPLPPVASNVIERIELRGLSGVTQDAVKATILSKVGDVYDEAALRRDVTALWKTERFDDVQLTTETGARGGIVARFVVIERP